MLQTATTPYESPASNPLIHYVLENPWPAVVILGVAAAVLAWLGARDGLASRFKAAAVLALLAVGVLASATVITTAGEHGERVTKAFVEHAIAGDDLAAMALLDANAVLTFGSPTNPGYDLAFIENALDQVDRRQIKSNRITHLRGYSIDGDAADVQLACSTETGGGYTGWTPTRWMLRVNRDASGEWKITRMTFISVAGQAPQRGWVQ